MSESAAATPTLIVSTAVTSTDHGKIVSLVAWLCLVVGILLLLARIYIRWPLRALVGKDDIVCAVATAFAIIQTAVTLSAVDNGYGKTDELLSQSQQLTVEKMIYSTDILYLLSLWTGKLSVSFLFHRLGAESTKSHLGWTLTGIVSTLGFVSVLVVALRQNTSTPWIYTASTMDSLLARWIAVGVLSTVFDILIAASSFSLVWALQLDQGTKSLVVAGFVLRLFVLPVTIIRLVSISYITATDWSFTSTTPQALTQLEMYCGLVATTLPCLRLFLRAWNSSFLDMRLEEVDPNAYHEHMTTHGGSYGKGSKQRSAGSFSPGPQALSGSRASPAGPSWAGQSQGRSRAYVQGGERDEDAASDNSQRAIMVRQTIAVSQE